MADEMIVMLCAITFAAIWKITSFYRAGSSLVMQKTVLLAAHYLKIFGPVVEFISIDMVNDFTSAQGSAKNVFFNDNAMLAPTLAVNRQISIASPNTTSSMFTLKSSSVTMIPNAIVMAVTKALSCMWLGAAFNCAFGIGSAWKSHA